MKTTEFPISPIGANIFASRIDDYEGAVVGVSPMLRDRQGLRAKVLAVGPDAHDVRKGDVIYIGRATGAELNLAGQAVVALREGDVLAYSRYEH